MTQRRREHSFRGGKFMSQRNIFSVRNILIAAATALFAALTFGLILFFINKKKKADRF
jgi:hypothetical protein